MPYLLQCIESLKQQFGRVGKTFQTNMDLFHSKTIMIIISTCAVDTPPCTLPIKAFIRRLNAITIRLLAGYVTSREDVKIQFSVPDRQRLWFCSARLAQSCLRNRCDTEICHHESPDSGLKQTDQPMGPVC